MGAPTTVNGAVATFDKVLEVLILDVGANIAIAAAIAEVPFLGLPVIKQIFSFFAKKVIGYLESYLEKLGSFQIIDLQVSAENKDYQSAVATLKIAQQNGDPDALAKAKEQFKSTLGNLIHSDGS